MFLEPTLVHVIHAERATQWLREAEISRLRHRPPRRPIRQAIGRSMVRIGARLASEPWPDGPTWRPFR